MEPDTFIDFGSLVPEILAAAGTAIALFTGWAATKFSQLTNIKIETAHREALHKAINTGIQLAIERFGVRVDVKNERIAQVAEWVIKSVPDALKALGLTDNAVNPTTNEVAGIDPKLKNLIESKLPLYEDAGGA
jgi:hypothetical protein